ncbi:MAG: DUF4124 domain-containing protein [Gammaproteobacteria bacterium]|nr:DUF4124 domain-containing protein [Gammaproteobacteria bacterium]
MLEIMKHTIIKSLLAALLLFTFTSHAGLYKGLDEDGNVLYSDTPFENAEKITPPPITIIDAPKVKPKQKVVEEEKQAETKYKKFSITAPKNEQTIWNEPALTVSLQLNPALATAEGHKIWLMMDGKPLVKNSQSLSLQIGRADRGEHKLQAQIRNKKGKIIKRTKTVTVYIQHTVIRKQAR